MNQPARTLSILGGSNDDIEKLGRLLAARPDSSWRTAAANHADVLIVDVDSVYGHMDWLKAQSSGRMVIALSAGDAHGAEHRLRKPVTTATLFELLDHVAVPPTLSNGHATPAAPGAPASPPRAATGPAVVATPATPAPAPAPAVSAAPPVAEPPPAPPAATKPRTLLNLLESSGRWRLQRDGMPPLFLDGSAQLAHAQDTALKVLANWGSLNLADAKVDLLEAAAFTAATRDLATLPYARLAWLAHLVGNNGQLEADLDAGARYKLTRWPQVERDFPKHFRIATAMMKAAGTVEEIAEASGAPVGEVANFINAYHASGHIESDPAGARRSR